MSQRVFFSALLILWLASRASADGGDDFANNLASDLGPIFALFGERVVMQFMSQAMGIADCILLAMAPIGAITTVVSAIRVAGPPWLKSFIGRARENLAAAEVDVMSSTSTETCELWNGNSVVRCPGLADICQFICLIPKEYGDTDLKQKKFRIRCEKLEDIAEDAETPTNRDKSEHSDMPVQNEEEPGGVRNVSKLLQKKKRASLGYNWQCFISSVGLFSDNLRRFRPFFPGSINRDEEEGAENSLGVFATDSTPSSSGKKLSANNSAITCSKYEKDIELVVVMDSLDDSAPNLLLNCHDRVGRSEIYIAAVFGTILQLGAIAYFAFITYHKSIQNQFLKDGKRVVEYAFPCAAIGTILLVFGLFICSWVVGESTKETYYEAANHTIFMVWIQKEHIVSDQVFKPYAIYPIGKREYITTSRRGIEHHPEELKTLFQNIVGRLSKDKCADFKQHNGKQETDAVEKSLYWPLKFITFVGALTSLIGFISQFVGMRGLNWTASVVQLGITIVLTMIRAIVRRGLGKPPAYTPLTRNYELDWFALSFGDLATVPWAPFRGVPSDSNNTKGNSRDENSSRWEICTGNESVYLPLDHVSMNDSPSGDNSIPHKMMLVRKSLGQHSKWQSLILEEAICLSRAIEAVAHTFLGGPPETDYVWSIPVKYTKKESMEPNEDNVFITIYKDGQHGWRVDEAVIEAILSLWLYSTSPAETSKTNRQRNLRLYGSSESEEQLARDLGWWMPENYPQISKLTEADIAKITNKENDCKIVGFRTEHDGAKTPTSTAAQIDLTKKYLVIENQDKKQKLFSRDLLFSFIRAVAKTPGVSIASIPSEYLLTYIKMETKWSQMKFKNETISELVRKLENIGFGTHSGIYMDILIPLSLEKKLPNANNIIDEARRLASEYELSHQWKNLVDTCLCLLDLAQQFNLETESSGPLAIAICLGYLYRLHHEERLQYSERRTEVEFTTQLKTLKESFNHEKIQSLACFPAALANELNFCAVSLSTLAAPNDNSTISFPDSFRISAKSLEVIREKNMRHKSQTPDIEDFEKTDAFGWSLLHYAANSTLDMDNNWQMSDEFIFPNPRDLMEWTPLHHACFFGNEEMVNMLLKYKTPIEIAGKDGITPMHCAVQSGNANIIQVLLKEVNSRQKKHRRKSKRHVDRNERHPIHWAAVEGNVEMVRLMKDDIGLADRFGWTPLHLAAIYEHKNLLQYISEDHTEAMNIGDNKLRTPLHLAVEYELEDAVRILIQAGAKVNTTAKDGSAPLHVAVKQKQKRILEMLLRNGANKEAMDLDGRTPFYLSVEDGEIEIINLLKDDGAEVTTAAKDGRTPLHVALSRGQDGLKVAEMLLEAGADVNTKALDGASGMHMAAQCGSLFEILNFLPDESLESLDFDATDEYGQTPLLIAIYEKEWEAAKLLLEKGASVNADTRNGYTPVLGAVMGEDEDTLQQLLEKGASVDDADGDGFSALHLSILNRNQRIFQALLNANANIDALISVRNDTPLHIAIRTRQTEIVQALLDKGANTMILNFRGFSPLQQALYSQSLAAVHKLIERDKISTTKAALQKNKEGDTPLHTLSARGFREGIKCRMLDELLSIGPEIEINAKNNEGLTPLDLALTEAREHRGYITNLLAKGAEPGSEAMSTTLENWKDHRLGSEALGEWQRHLRMSEPDEFDLSR